MQNVQAAPSGLRATLSEMGYPKKMISLAFKDAKIHTLDHILELLISKEAEYNEILAEQKPLKVVPPNDNVEANPNKRKNSNKQEEKQRNRENKNANKSEKREKANENIQSKEKEQEFASEDDDENKVNDDDEEEDEIPKSMDTESLNYTQSMIQGLKRIRSAKDSTWFIVELSDQLKSLQFETNDGATKVRYYLDVPRQYPRIEEYKKAVYLIIVKVLNSKVSKKYRMNFEDLETVLTLAFELRLLRARQMENVISLYPKLCARHMYKPNEEMIAKLEKIHQEVKSKQKDDHEEVLPEEELEEEKEEEKAEEPTGPTGEDVVEAEAEVFIPTRDQEKEYCIICVQRFREIVFMPCCHFLTCLLCSSKIGKCPVCNNKVHKHLQIFWS